MAKNSVDAYQADGKTNLLMFDPNNLVLVTDQTDPLYDPRVHDELDAAFVANIKSFGVLTPITVWKDPETGEVKVVYGRQRVKAAREANKALAKEGGQLIKVPATVRRGSAVQMTAIMVIENELRRDDTPLRKAEKMQRLQAMGVSEDELAVIFGITGQTVRYTLRLLDQPSAVRNAVEAGHIPIRIAAQLQKLPVEEQRTQLAKIMEAGEGKKGRAKARSQRQAAGVKQPMRTRAEVASYYKRANGEAAAALAWVLGDPWNEGIPLKP